MIQQMMMMRAGPDLFGYVYAGQAAGGYLQDCDEYSQSGNSWTSKTDMPTPARNNLAASTI